MDCRTARLLLEFSRPHAPDLGPPEAEELDRHLAHCIRCDALSRGERRCDATLARAMRQVEVPDQFRAQLLARLEGERGKWYRHRIGHALRACAAVAAVLLLAWAWWQWYEPNHRPAIDPDPFYGDAAVAHHSREDVQASFQRLGVDTPLPENFNYTYLTWYGVTELPGHPGLKVPVLQFTQTAPHTQALVYIVSDRKFNLDQLKGPVFASGSRYKLQVILPPNQHLSLIHI